MEIRLEEIVKLTQPQLKNVLLDYLKELNYTTIINEDGFLYAKGTEPILLCCHLDTVHKEPVRDLCISDTGILMSPQGIGGDDRCGVFMVSTLLKSCKCSVVFTEDEEIGCVGAGKFVDYMKKETENGVEIIDRNYNFIVEIDRKGSNDCVFYGDDNEEFHKFVETFGFTTAFGSCSDISKIAPYLKTSAVNISSGYYNPHQISEYIDYNVVVENIDKIYNLITSESKHYEYTQKVYTYTGLTYNFNNYKSSSVGFNTGISQSGNSNNLYGFANKTNRCVCCGKTKKKNKLKWSDYYAGYICKDCESKDKTMYDYCDWCGQVYMSDSLEFEDASAMMLCPDCYKYLSSAYTTNDKAKEKKDEPLIYCNACGEEIREKDVTYLSDIPFCKDCAKDFFVCKECGDVFYKQERYKNSQENICTYCKKDKDKTSKKGD